MNRAKTCGMPERFAQEALDQNSKDVHRAYAERLSLNIKMNDKGSRRSQEPATTDPNI